MISQDSHEYDQGPSFSPTQGENFGRRKSDEPATFERNEIGVTIPTNNDALRDAERALHNFGMPRDVSDVASGAGFVSVAQMRLFE